mgnify:CR=1 FL=1
MDNANFLENLSRSVGRNKAAADTTKDALTRTRATKSAEDAEKMIIKIDQKGESVVEMGMSIMPISTEEEVLEKIEKKVKSSAAVAGCRVRNLANLQKEGLKQLSPFHTTEPKINQVINRVIPLSTFVGGFPFAKTGYTDGTGYYFAKDSLGGLIILEKRIRSDKFQYYIYGSPWSWKIDSFEAYSFSGVYERDKNHIYRPTQRI